MNWKRNIRMFLSAQTISLFGSSLVQYAIIWYITLSTSSGWMMSIATLCGYVPQILISLFAGVWIDRYPKKRLIMASDAMIAIATLLCALLIMNGYQSVEQLFVLLAIRSIGTGIQTPCVNAMMPDIVPSQELLHYNGINSSLSSITMFLSPACSGILYAAAPLESIFFIDVFTAVIGISLTMCIRMQHQVQPQQDHFFQELKNGFHYIQHHDALIKQLVFLFVVLFLISPAAFLTPLLIERTFGNEVWRLPVSEMMFSLGAVAGGIWIAKAKLSISKPRMVVYASILYGAMMTGIGCSPIYICYLLFNCLVGVSMPCFNAPLNAMLQEEVEEQMLGRVFSIVQIINACSLPLGTLVFGPMADHMKVSLIFVCCGISVVVFSFFYRRIMK